MKVQITLSGCEAESRLVNKRSIRVSNTDDKDSILIEHDDLGVFRPIGVFDAKELLKCIQNTTNL